MHTQQHLYPCYNSINYQSKRSHLSEIVVEDTNDCHSPASGAFIQIETLIYSLYAEHVTSNANWHPYMFMENHSQINVACVIVWLLCAGKRLLYELKGSTFSTPIPIFQYQTIEKQKVEL